MGKDKRFCRKSKTEDLRKRRKNCCDVCLVAKPSPMAGVFQRWNWIVKLIPQINIFKEKYLIYFTKCFFFFWRLFIFHVKKNASSNVSKFLGFFLLHPIYFGLVFFTFINCSFGLYKLIKNHSIRLTVIFLVFGYNVVSHKIYSIFKIYIFNVVSNKIYLMIKEIYF